MYVLWVVLSVTDSVGSMNRTGSFLIAHVSFRALQKPLGVFLIQSPAKCSVSLYHNAPYPIAPNRISPSAWDQLTPYLSTYQEEYGCDMRHAESRFHRGEISNDTEHSGMFCIRFAKFPDLVPDQIQSAKPHSRSFSVRWGIH